MSLREKINAVADYMEENKYMSRSELKGIRTILTNQDHVLSVDSLNAYVHNMNYNPTPIDFKTNWNNIQPFIEKIWSI